MRILAASIGLHHPETHVVHSFVKGDTLPDWAVPLVTNPAAFVDDGDENARRLAAHDSLDSRSAAGAEAIAGNPPAPEPDQVEGEAEGSEAAWVDLDGKNKDELLVIAESEGLDVNTRLGAEKLADAIREARAAKTEQ